MEVRESLAEKIVKEMVRELAAESSVNGIDKAVLDTIYDDWKRYYDEIKTLIKEKENNNSSVEAIEEEGAYGGVRDENLEFLDFSEELGVSEENAYEADIRKAESTENKYLLSLFSTVKRQKGKFECEFKTGFVNPGKYTDIPFQNGSAKLEW